MLTCENSTSAPGCTSDPLEAAFYEAVAELLKCAKAMDPTITGGWMSRAVAPGEPQNGMPTAIGFDRKAVAA
jgi:hypothetical protein